MTTPDPAAIARGLSEQMKKTLSDVCDRPGRSAGGSGWSLATLDALFDRGLISSFISRFNYSRNRKYSHEWYATPLGVAVREEILREKGS